MAITSAPYTFAMELFRLDGKKAIITGAAKQNGLGCSIARALRAVGARVVILDVLDCLPETVALLNSTDGGGYAGIYADLSEQQSMEAGFWQALSSLGGEVDILVNSAGVHCRKTAIEHSYQEWQSVINVNLNAMFLMCQLAGQKMLEQGSGKILNIASISGFVGPRNMCAYASSKGGVIQLTKALSTEWSPHGINVNAIAPGTMITDFTADVRETVQGKELKEKIPMQRFGYPKDIDGAAVFLVSPAASYISGITLPVDGGVLGR